MDSGNWMHTIRHPIQCHDASVCADIISKTGVVELHEDLLKSSNVKLMQQMLRRTDVDPEAEKRGAATRSAGIWYARLPTRERRLVLTTRLAVDRTTASSRRCTRRNRGRCTTTR